MRFFVLRSVKKWIINTLIQFFVQLAIQFLPGLMLFYMYLAKQNFSLVHMLHYR